MTKNRILRLAFVALVGLLAARWAWAPGTAASDIACIEGCAAACGFPVGHEVTVADVACLRRRLANEVAACP